MNFSDIKSKIKLSALSPEAKDGNFTVDEEKDIFKALEKSYQYSKTARKMFEQWIEKGQTIDIKCDRSTAGIGQLNTGLVFINPKLVKTLSYISTNGTAVPYTLIGALTHELGHALTGRSDPKFNSEEILAGDYWGTNVPFVNIIWEELTNSGKPDLKLPPMRDYIATADSELQKPGYKYTNGKKIDTAVNVDYWKVNDWDSSGQGPSDDLLIGASRNNNLISGDGNDFLFGGGGDDVLDGGNGTDTAVYFGKETDYEIYQNKKFVLNWLDSGWKWDGTWTVKHVRGKKDGDGDLINNAGTDILKKIEFLQFDDNKKYPLIKDGLSFQSDLTLAIDTTGSMGGSIGSVVAQAAALLNGLFDKAPDSRVSIVGYKDTEYGEPSQVILPFTEQVEFADRKAAAIAALNTISVGGGGDWPETAFDGLKTALNETLVGQWRGGAGTRRIVLFTDAPAKDGALAAEVTAMAHNIGGGVEIVKHSSRAFTGGNVDTFSLAPTSSTTSSTSKSELEGLVGAIESTDPSPTPVNLSEEPIDFDPTPAQVQIFTIYTGPSDGDTRSLADIASANGGTFFTAPSNEELVNTLLKIINEPPVDTTPSIYLTTSFDAAEANPDEDASPGQFILTRWGNLSEALTVTYNLSGTAAAGVDYQALPGTITFGAGEDTATIDLDIIDDNIYEGTERVTLTIDDNPTYTLDYGNAKTIELFDNEFQKSQLIQPAASNSILLEGGAGQSLLKFTKLSNTGDNKNELAAFVVDDEQGSIDGILPGDDRYLAAAIARSQVVFSSLGDNEIDRQFDLDSQRYLNFNSGDRIQFLLVVDDTIDSIKASLDAGNSVANVIFSLPTANLNNSVGSQFTALPDNGGYQIAWADTLDGDNNKFDNFVIQMQTSDSYAPTIGNGLQGSLLGEVIDLRDFSEQTLKLDIVTVSDARYNNYIGFYEVEDASGTLANGLKPGDIGYAEAAIKNAMLQSYKNESKSDLTVSGGKILAPVVIANGTFKDFMDLNPENQASSVHAYFNYIGANTDKVDHFRLLGDNKFGVEDMYGGGDRDYNDLVIQLAVRN